MIIDEDTFLEHYGILRKSGRYPWGSGETQTQRNRSFLDIVEDLRKKGMSETEIARGFSTPEHPFTTTQLRALKSIAKNAETQADIAMAERLKAKGNSNVAIGKRMGINESSVRALLDPGKKDRVDVLEATSSMLKAQVDAKGYIDIGSGVERHIGISQTKLSTAVARLQEEGYTVHFVNVEQLGTGHQTLLKVLAAPGTTPSEMYRNRSEIKQVTNFSDDGGRSYEILRPPTPIDSKRVAVRYGKDGGAAADGVIYVRPGVDDTSLGRSSYAQVRITVDGTHYLKGMAVYKDNLPDGVDLMFNTNKSDTGDKKDAMKKVSSDPDNPFGSAISRQHGVMNIVNEEGDWSEWSKSLSSQFLSKQTPVLAKTQLDMTYENKQRELEGIKKTDNPAVQKRLLESFADDADSSAVHLKAAALPRQENKVILPLDSLKENEIYAPSFNNGERVVLIRHPHAGIFEIPELTVNNRNPEGKRLLGTNPTDAIGIHSKVAERLSGADFDGDTVLVIPNDRGRVKTAPALEGLKGFDPKHSYPAYEGMLKMLPRTKQVEMGKISNLIADMTLQGANSTELAAAARHGMVVIDAEKHNLNYRQSAIDNGISALKEKYQGSKTGGAATVISNSGTSSTVRVPERKQGYSIDPITGKKVFKETGATYVDKDGHTVVKTTEVSKLGNVDDAHVFSTGTPVEKIYADHSNKLKALANSARRTSTSIAPVAYSPEAKVKYANEVRSLDAKLNLALRNSPLERQAQILANAVVSQKRAANPDMEKAEIKKLKFKALEESRARTGAKKQRIEISDAEWAAIQAGAISNSKLNQILSNSDLDRIKQLATPKTVVKMSTVRLANAQALLAAGYTQAEVAAHLGVSVSTLQRGLGGDK
jgi:DNA-binding CsgD family transcriptional regulator